MTMYFLQLFLWLLLFFAIGALLAWVVVRALYRPIDEVRSDLVEETAAARRVVR